jgi:hypothetical protein
MGYSWGFSLWMGFGLELTLDKDKLRALYARWRNDPNILKDELEEDERWYEIFNDEKQLEAAFESFVLTLHGSDTTAGQACNVPAGGGAAGHSAPAKAGVSKSKKQKQKQKKQNAKKMQKLLEVAEIQQQARKESLTVSDGSPDSSWHRTVKLKIVMHSVTEALHCFLFLDGTDLNHGLSGNNGCPEEPDDEGPTCRHLGGMEITAKHRQHLKEAVEALGFGAGDVPTNDPQWLMAHCFCGG